MLKKILLVFIMVTILVFILYNKSLEEEKFKSKKLPEPKPVIDEKKIEIKIDNPPILEIKYTPKNNNRLLERFLKQVETDKKKPQRQEFVMEEFFINNIEEVIIINNNVNYGDIHNSHDSNINTEMDRQYYEMKRKLIKNPECPDLYNYLSMFEDYKINVFLKTITNDMFRDMDGEWDIYYNIWYRIFMFDGRLLDSMIEAFLSSIRDCVRDDGYIHCSTGRVSRLFSSLAILDPEFGVLKTEDIIKKEIYDKCSFLIENFEGEDEDITKYLHKEIKKEYSKVVNLNTLDKILKSISEAYE